MTENTIKDMSNLQDHPLVQAYIRLNNFGNLLGMDFKIESAGRVVYSMKIETKHLATPMASHGGAIAAMMDAALGVAALSAVCESDKVVSTLEMSVRFIAPAKPGDELTANATVLSRGNRILVVQAEIYNQDQKLVALGNGTFNAYPKEKAGF